MFLKGQLDRTQTSPTGQLHIDICSDRDTVHLKKTWKNERRKFLCAPSHCLSKEAVGHYPVFSYHHKLHEIHVTNRSKNFYVSPPTNIVKSALRILNAPFSLRASFLDKFFFQKAKYCLFE